MNIAQNPNSELSHFAVNTPQVFEIPETFRETARQFQEAMMQYSCAIREFKTKLENEYTVTDRPRRSLPDPNRERMVERSFCGSMSVVLMT